MPEMILVSPFVLGIVSSYFIHHSLIKPLGNKMHTNKNHNLKQYGLK
ncbi:hypothetical protein H6761_03905 [Candidatus Nomurabacteria bacterium]|nr:hypothetical protein [Candidatus Nomurabacteria bacterium]